MEEDVDSQTRFLYYSVDYNSTISIRIDFFSHTPIYHRKREVQRYSLVSRREMILRVFLIITLLIVLPLDAHALSPFHSFRNLEEQQSNVSALPSPSLGENLASSGGSNFLQSRNSQFRSCQLKNITACLTYSRSGPHEEIYLFVQNNGENPLNVTIMILPANHTIKEINLTSHRMKMVHISSDVDLSSTIALTTSNGDCVIHAAAPAPENYYQKQPSYITYITPINGAYIVIIVLIVDGILTFFKLWTRVRHLDGVPYHELEMGNSTNVEEKENWEQDWDDGKPVKSGGDDSVIVKQVNGLATKLEKSNGRIKEWDD